MDQVNERHRHVVPGGQRTRCGCATCSCRSATSATPLPDRRHAPHRRRVLPARTGVSRGHHRRDPVRLPARHPVDQLPDVAERVPDGRAPRWPACWASSDSAPPPDAAARRRQCKCPAQPRPATRHRGHRCALRLPARATTCCAASTSRSGRVSGSPSSARPGPASQPWPSCWPASTSRATAASASAAGRSPPLAPDDRRSRVALVTQEHHVFRGTLRDNLAIAEPVRRRRARCRPPSTAVGAGDWADGPALDAATGPGRRRPALDPAQVQQLALARLILAEPATRSSWTRPPRCSAPARPGTWNARWRRSSAAARSSRSCTACTPPATPTASRSSRTAGHRARHPRRAARPRAAVTRRCGTPGRAP